jgi:hypothetical protein
MFTKISSTVWATAAFRAVATTRKIGGVVNSEYVELLKVTLNMQRIANNVSYGAVKLAIPRQLRNSLPSGFVRPAPPSFFSWKV